MNDFPFCELPGLDHRVFRLGLSGSFDLDEDGCSEALERIQYVFWSPRMTGLTVALRRVLTHDRERYVVSAGPLLGYTPGAQPQRLETSTGSPAAMASLTTRPHGSDTLGRTRAGVFRSPDD